MKVSAYMLAFILSAAIHVGALTSNLLHVNASSVSENRAQTVRLHIVPAAIRMPSTQPAKEAQETAETPRAIHPEMPDSDRPEPHVDPLPAAPGVKSPEVVLTAMPTALQVPVYREEIRWPDITTQSLRRMPDPPPVAAPPAVKEITEELTDIRSVAADGPENRPDPCDNCSASLSSFPSLIPNAAPSPGSDAGPTNPAVITFPSKPKYPRYSRLHKEEGTTVLLVEILPDGSLGRVEITRSSGYRRLDEAALKGIRKADLVPAVENGRNVASVRHISIRFDLEDWGE